MGGSRESSARFSLEMLRGCRILVTGASGFVGTALLAALAEAEFSRYDISVVGLSRRPPGPRFDAYQIAGRLRWVQADVTSRWPDLGPFDCVIHAATASSARAQAASPLGTVNVVVQGMRALIEWASHQKTPPRVLFTSSGAVYGPQRDDEGALEPSRAGSLESFGASAYAEAKRISETMLFLADQEGLLNAINARLFTFIGPSLPLDQHFAVGNFIADAVAGRTIQVMGTGKVVRSYMYEADMAAWLLAALARGPDRVSLNVGSSEGRTLAAVASLVSEAAGVPVKIVGDETLDGLRKRYVPDTVDTRSRLGVAEWTDLALAIRRTLQAKSREC